MTKPSHTQHIPPEYLHAAEKPRFILWLLSLNLPPEAAFRTYRDWCHETSSQVMRSDLDDLCGKDFHIT